MRIKKVNFHCQILPETMRKINEMTNTANKKYHGKHSKGSIVDIAFRELKEPVERQRDKVRELAAALHMEREILESMESTKVNEAQREIAKKIITEAH